MSTAAMMRGAGEPAQEGDSVPKHMPALDGLRAIAILLVIPHNLDILVAPIPALAQPAALLMHVGWIGVQLFFVLSGFLITGNLLDTRNASNYYTAFFGRRVLRIFPLYYTVLAVVLVLVPLFNVAPDALRATLRNQVWLWTFLSNWTQPYGHGVTGFSHFWSLAIEEQFYLLWPFIVFRSSPNRMFILCVGVTCAALVIRFAMSAAGASDDAIYTFTVSRMDALACGGAAAALLRSPALHTGSKRAVNMAAAAMLILFVVGAGFTRGYFAHDPTCQTWGYSLLAVVFAVIVYAAARESFKEHRLLWCLLTNAPLRLVGRYSYGMYVFHLPLHVFLGAPALQRFFPHINVFGTLAYIATMVLVSFMVAALSYELFERRFLLLKRRFSPVYSQASRTQSRA